MNPYRGYPLGEVKLGRGARSQALPWDVIDALVDHATWAGRPITARSGKGLLALLTREGSYVSQFNASNGQVLVVTTTPEPPTTTVTLRSSDQKTRGA